MSERSKTKSLIAHRKRAVIVQKTIPHYRLRLLELLRERLDEREIDLFVIYGQPLGNEATRLDTVGIEWGLQVNSREIMFPGERLIWQPVLSHLKSGDLVIVEQASRLLVNYLLLFKQQVGDIQLALWGHGRNLDSENRSRLGEALKRRFSRRVHWWFAYTAESASIVHDTGFPNERITVVQNSIDTTSLRRYADQIQKKDLINTRAQLGIEGTHIGIYCGGLYRQKRIPFLIEAAKTLRGTLTDFELLIIGSGPDREVVEKAAQEYPWIHFAGPLFDREKALLFALSDLMLMPGWTGLSILDSFVLETPMVTLDGPQPPEIEYVSTNENGIRLPAETTAEEYAKALFELFGDAAEIERLRIGCRKSAQRFTIETMAERFADGIDHALTRN